MDPKKFRAHLEAELGKQGADLATVAPGQQGERSDLVETSSDDRKKCGHDKTAKLCAILRPPELIQDLYRQGLVSQTVAELRRMMADFSTLRCTDHDTM